MTNTRTKSRRWLTTVAVTATLVVSAACGGGGDSDQASDSTTSTTAHADDAMLAYGRCMKANGVQMPAGGIVLDGSNGQGDDPTKDPDFNKANQACKQHLKGITVSGDDHTIPADQQDAMLNYARCMRDKGVNMPDPSSNGLVNRKGQSDFDDKSPEFRKEHDRCRSHLGELKAEETGR